MGKELNSEAIEETLGESLLPPTCRAQAGDAQGGPGGHVEHAAEFLFHSAAQGAGASSSGRQLVSRSRHGACIQLGGEACAGAGQRQDRDGVGRDAAVTWRGGLANDKPAAESWKLCSSTSAGKKLCKDISLLGMPLAFCRLFSSGRIGNRH